MKRMFFIILIGMGPALLWAFILGPISDRFFDSGDRFLWIMAGLLATLVLYIFTEFLFGRGGIFGPLIPPPTPDEIRAIAAWKMLKGGHEIAEGWEMLQHLEHAEHAEEEKKPPPKKGLNWWWVIILILGGIATYWWLFLR